MNRTSSDSLTAAVELRQAGKGEKALQMLHRLLTAAPQDPQLNYQCAWTCDSLGLESEAVGYYETAIAQGLEGEDLRGALLGLGSTYRCRGRYEEAEATLRRGLEQFPDGTEFDVFLALTEYNRRAYPKAMERLLKLLLATTADPHIKKYSRALAFYTDKLDQTW
jgi:tetratricopeptide (TPR) repeat protein